MLVLKILRFLRIPGAELATIVFALHPVNVETVAWIAERKNTLSGVFGLAATLWYLKFDESRNGREKDGPQGRGYRNYALAIGLFVLGLLTKTSIVALPLAWLVIFWWKRGAISWRRDVVPLVPFLFLSAAAGLMTRWVEYGNIAYRARDLDFSFLDRCLIAGRAFWFQLSKLLWPSNLMFVYPRWDINAGVWWQYLFPLAVLGLLGILWSLRRWSRAPLAGVLVYILLLLPTLGFLNIYFFFYSFVADHWQYLACLGIITPCASGIVLLTERFKLGKRGWSLEPRCCWAEYCSFSPRSKAGCIPTSKRCIGRLSPVIPLAGWRRLTSVTSCTRPTGFRRRWTCLSKPCESSRPSHIIA